MAAIKQRDLNLMDREGVDEFEITGRNFDTDAPSRMQASEMLAGVYNAISDEIAGVDEHLTNLDKRVSELEGELERLPLTSVVDGDNLRGRKITFENTELLPSSTGDEQFILFEDGSGLYYYPGGDLYFNMLGQRITVYSNFSGWIKTDVLLPDSDLIVGAINIKPGTTDTWGFDSAYSNDVDAVDRRLSDLESDVRVLNNDVKGITETLNNDVVLRVSNATQVVNSNITLGVNPDGTRSGLFLQRENGFHENAVKLGLYGTYEQEEHASEADPTCVNHCGTATDGTVVGDNFIVNYKSEQGGVQKADAVAYILKDIDPILQRLTALEQGSTRIYGDISTTGQAISFSLGSVTFLVRRLDTTTIEIRATSTTEIVVPITHRYAGGSLTDAVRSTPITVGPTGSVIDTVGVGNVVIADFYTRIGDYGYDITAGSEDDALTEAWVEVKRSIVVRSQTRDAVVDPYEDTRLFCEWLSDELNKNKEDK